MRGLGLGFDNPMTTGGVLDMCVFGLPWCRCGVGSGIGPGLEGWGGVISVRCESGLSV